MSPITELKYNILASLYFKPATIEELLEREFLKTTSRYGVERMVHTLDMSGHIYYRGENDKMFVYKEPARKVLNENGYEIV